MARAACQVECLHYHPRTPESFLSTAACSYMSRRAGIILTQSSPTGQEEESTLTE